MKVLNSQGAIIDITIAASKRVFGIFAALTESKHELIAERTTAGLASARVRGRKSGRPYKVTLTKLRLAMALMGQPKTRFNARCLEFGITGMTPYQHIASDGKIRHDGKKLLNRVYSFYFL